MPNRHQLSLRGCFPLRGGFTLALALGVFSACGAGPGATNATESVPADLHHCANLSDETALPIQVRIENRTSRALYVGPVAQPCYQYFNSQPFDVVDDAGLVGSDRECGNVSCGELARGSTIVECLAICIDYAPFTLLQPGESMKAPWSPKRLTRYELPLKCLGPSELQRSSCTRAERIALGTTLTFGAQGIGELDCSNVPDGCACSPSAGGGCVVQAKALTGAQVIQATSSILLDEDYLTGGDARVVELAFEE